MNCNKNDIETLIAQFEAGSLPINQWGHKAHLTVALWYLSKDPLKVATQKIKAGIQSYNASNGIVQTPTRGYHETLTLFWILLIHQYLENFQRHREYDMTMLLDGLLEVYCNPQIPLQYYSRDRLMSWEARTVWLEPDLRPLPR